MTTIDTLLQRNRDFAAQRFTAGLPMLPTLRTLILGCADPRVDPAHVLGLAPGDAAILRNVGGRVTPGTLQQLRMLLQIPTEATTNPGNEGTPFNLIVLQHTQCGITRMASNTALMSAYFVIPPEDLPAREILDPHAAVAVDVAILRTAVDLPASTLLSGLVYDTTTGLVEVVVPSAPLREP